MSPHPALLMSFDLRPLVAVTATTRDSDGASRVRLNVAYLRALEHAGAVPLVVPPVADAGRVLDAVDGLLLTGGEDVEPWRYGVAPSTRLGATHAARDTTEIALIAGARERALPTLAICRGIQVLTVALGGTLIQDIPSERPDALSHDPGGERGTRSHEVTIDEGSRLAEAVGATRLVVNSFHHQAPAVVPASLRASARSPDGLIEGVEATDPGWWALGVQWHPEELVETSEPWDRGLFDSFAARCRAASSTETRRARSSG